MCVCVCVCVCVCMHVVALCCLHMHSRVGVGTTAYNYEFSFALCTVPPYLTTPSTPILMFLHTYTNNISRIDCAAHNIQSLCACVSERKIKQWVWKEKRKTYICVSISGSHNHHLGVECFILSNGNIVDPGEEDGGLLIPKDVHVHCCSVGCQEAPSILQFNLELWKRE